MSHRRTGLAAALRMVMAIGFASAGSATLAETLAATSAEDIQGRPPMTIASYGGPYVRSQMIAYVKPFREATKRWVEVVDFNGGLAEIRDQVDAENVRWDIVDLESPDLVAACDEGLLETIDPAILPPAPDGTSATKDFLPVALTPCGVGSVIWSTVVAYNPTALGGSGPSSLRDFFDTDAFPGPRGLRRSPRVNLEWALIADGVAPSDVYKVLGTPDGLRRAFENLDRIKANIVWWERGSTPISWLKSGHVPMTSVWSGRAYQAIESRGMNAVVLWDGQVLDVNFWAIPKGSLHHQRARNFIAFASDPKRMSEQVNLIAYGPARRSAMAFVNPEVRPSLPTNAKNRRTALVSNVAWWAANNERVSAAFESWIARRPLRDLFYRSDGN